MKSVYIHIPFCDKICSYCDFCKLLNNKKLINKYLDALEKEIKNNYKGESLKTIYIGGGTPSCLTLNQLERLFKILNLLKKEEEIEFTIECNFENTTREKLDLFKRYGINRLSFGLETTNKEKLMLLNREFDKCKVESIISYAKKIKIKNINIDLIYALFNQSIQDIEKDLDFIIDLDVPHISTYSLIIEDNTVLKIRGMKNIEEDLDYEMYTFICKYLKKKNFTHYEISNFSKKGYESRHNNIYWQNKEYYGFGLGASGYIENERYTNTRSLTNYLKGKYKLESELLSEQDIMNYEIILNLRRKKGINKLLFKEKFKKEVNTCYNYSELVINKWIIENNKNIYIPEDKWYISNEIIVKFLEGVTNE